MIRTVALLILLASLTLGTCAHAAGKLVAAILSSDLPRFRDANRSMQKTLAQRGIHPPAVEFLTQTPNADPISWANSIRKAEALGASVVVTFGAPVSLMAVQEGIKTPIVFSDVYGPVEVGLSKSLTTMNSQVCGVTSKVPLMTLIKSAVSIKPFKSLAVIYSSREAGSLVQLKELKRIAASSGFAIIDYNVSSMPQLEHLLNGELQGAEALFVSESSVGSRSFDRIADFCQVQKIPLLSTMPEGAERGALLSLEISPAEQGQLAADYVAKILSGKKVAQPAIASPKHIELIVNLKVARQLSLTVPFQVLSAATRAIK